MAKFANVTYGTHGDTELYTYVVNDNVRAGDYIQPSVKHYESGKVFGTTAIVQSTTRTTSVKGLQLQQELQNENVEVAQAFTGKEVGAKPQRNRIGRFNDPSGLKKTVKNPDTGLRQAPEGAQFRESSYIRQTRQANVELRKAEDDFDSYSAKFMPKNNGE